MFRRQFGGLLDPPPSPQEFLQTRGDSFGPAFGGQEGPTEESRGANTILEQFRTPQKAIKCASGAPKGTHKSHQYVQNIILSHNGELLWEPAFFIDNMQFFVAENGFLAHPNPVKEG